MMADPYDIEKIVDYYVNLLIVQYHDLPKAQETIRLLVNSLWASGILFQIRDAFGVDDAIGAQLDIVGKYVGIDRYFQGQNFDGFFSLIPQGDTPDADQVGFTTQAEFLSENSPTLIYADILSTKQTLTDEAFRTLIKFKIIINNSNFSHADIDANLFAFFGDGIIMDSVGNMQMFYFVTREFYQTSIIALQKEILPRPMGVEITYIIEEDQPFFGLGSYKEPDSPFITGFTTQADYGTTTGQTLNYGDLSTG